MVGGYIQWSQTNPGVVFNIPTDGGQPSLASDAMQKLFVHASSALVGVLYVESVPTAVAYGDVAVDCTPDMVTGFVTCTAPTKGFDTLFQCGAYIYLATATWASSGCNRMQVAFG